jgi:hypothetical protein
MAGLVVVVVEMKTGLFGFPKREEVRSLAVVAVEEEELTTPLLKQGKTVGHGGHIS